MSEWKTWRREDPCDDDYIRAYRYTRVDIRRGDSAIIKTVNPRDLPDWFNAWGLWWRPTEIAE